MILIEDMNSVKRELEVNTDVHFNEQTISVYSKRNIFMRLQMHLNQLK